MWMILKQKISDDFSARDTEIKTFINAENFNTELNNKLTTEIEKFKTSDASYATEAFRDLITSKKHVKIILTELDL